MKSKMIQTTVLVTMLATSSLANALGSSINIKTASLTLSEKTQNIGSRTVTFDDSASSVFSIEYEREFGLGLSWGIETISYSNDILASSPSTSANDMNTLIVMGTIRKYFDLSPHVKPYFGAGAGVSVVTIVGSGSGIGFQGMVGVKFPFDSVSAILEYKVISSEPDDDLGASVDVSSDGVFAGVSINF